MKSTSVKTNKKSWTDEEDEKLLQFLEGKGTKVKWYHIFYPDNNTRLKSIYQVENFF